MQREVNLPFSLEGQPKIIIWIKQKDLMYTMLYTKFQGSWLLISRDKIFKVFLLYMGMANILEPFE